MKHTNSSLAAIREELFPELKDAKTLSMDVALERIKERQGGQPSIIMVDDIHQVLEHPEKETRRQIFFMLYGLSLSGLASVVMTSSELTAAEEINQEFMTSRSFEIWEMTEMEKEPFINFLIKQYNEIESLKEAERTNKKKGFLFSDKTANQFYDEVGANY